MELLTIPDVAAALGLPVNRVHQCLRDGELVGVRDAAGVRRVPARFVQDGAVVKSLPQVVRLLRDARFSDDEIVDWLFRPDDSGLRFGSPIEELRADRGTEVKRRAQAAGF